MNVNFEGKEFELPKWTMKLARMQDDVEKETTNEQLYKKAYEFVKEIIPKSDIADVLDGKTLETLDLIKLNNFYRLTCAKYMDALKETTMELAKEKYEDIADMLEIAEKAMALQNSQQ